MVPCIPFKFAESQVKARVPNSKKKILTNRRLNFDLPRAKLRQLAGEFALLADQRADRNLLYKKVAAHMKNNIASCAKKKCRTHRYTSYELGNRRVASREVLGQVN